MSENTTEFGPLEATLPRDLATNNDRLLITRWAAGVLVLAATAFCAHVLNLPLPETLLYLLGFFILAYNGGLTWAISRARLTDHRLYMARLRRFVIVQIALDWLSMAVFLHLTGGITSPALIFFFLHVLMVTILLPGQPPYLYAALAIGVAVAIAALEATGVLPHYIVIPGLPSDLHTDLAYVVAQIIFFATALFATVYLTASIMARLRERDRKIAALFQTTHDVSSTLNLSDVLDQLARNAAQALFVPAASIRTIDEDGDRLRIAAAYGLSQAYFDKGAVELSGNPLARRVLATGPVIVPDTNNEPGLQYPEKVTEEGIQSMLVVPIAGRTRPLGLLRVYAHEPNYFTEDDADFVLTIAQQGATAIENALAHDALQRVDQEREQFVRIVTHELRSPVTGAQSLLSILLRGMLGKLTPKQHDIIERLDRRMDALLALINDLLVFAAAKSGQHDPLDAVPLQPTLRRVIDRFAAQAEEKHLTLTCQEACDELLSVQATEEGLVRILDNLVGNAVKYTPDGGAVRISVAPGTQPGTAAVAVADTGIGIPAEVIDRLGEEFFRASNAKQSGITGTGLGVAIVKQLIDRFGGQMHVESAEGKGTTFTVTLPVVGQEQGKAGAS
ncbi:MAG: GAF domain-containing sensor histidine kinase [Anaerolineae bacterium]|nr:GAF domain-containing sensor histidine kinase [Anaerolineae bacterium]